MLSSKDYNQILVIASSSNIYVYARPNKYPYTPYLDVSNPGHVTISVATDLTQLPLLLSRLDRI